MTETNSGMENNFQIVRRNPYGLIQNRIRRYNCTNSVAISSMQFINEIDFEIQEKW